MTIWTYSQTTGELLRDGQYAATGYSGHGEGVNNPEMQSVRNVGPIPCGRYRCGPARGNKGLGPCAVPLTPVGHSCMGRSGFYVHGDNRKRNRSASNGCIIMVRVVRERMLDGDFVDVVT